jgi:hypothetical protein
MGSGELRLYVFLRDLEGRCRTLDWQAVTPEQAAQWLLEVGLFRHPGLPENVQHAVARMEL